MKRFFSIILLLVFIVPLTAFAASEPSAATGVPESYDKTYRRYNDYVSAVSEEQELTLNEKAKSRIEELRTDFPVCVFDTLSEGKTLREFADDYYTRNNFGYGENKTGVLLVLDLKNNKVAVYYYGDAIKLVSEENDDFITDSFIADCKDDSKTYYDVFDNYFDNVFSVIENARLAPTEIDKSDNANGMPYWYPLDYSGFTDFHGEDLPLVVDDANIFTKEQIAELTSKIQTMKDKYGIGYVAFTDDDNHGLLPEAYSSDFLHFNGYGVGDGYGAVVFYLSLDPADRCWLTTSINTYEDIFTRGVTYDIDELVDSDIRAGRYYEAFIKHADFVDELFSRLTTDLPEWYPEGTATFEINRENRRFAEEIDLSKQRIVDNAGLFDAEETEKYEKTLDLLAETYGVDVVVFTDDKVHTVYYEDYAEDFLYYNGYKKDCIIYYILAGRKDVIFYGECDEKYSSLCYSLYLRVKEEYDDNGATASLSEFCDDVSFMLKHDRLPVTAGVLIFCIAGGVIAALIARAVKASGLVAKMKVDIQISAAEYLVNNSLVIKNKNAVYSHSTVTKTPRHTDSSSSGSSGRSSGGSSYSSGRSSGGSYSSGGRRF